MKPGFFLLNAIAVLLGLSFPHPAPAGEVMRFIHAPPETLGDQRHAYYWDLLAAALESNKKKYGPYVIQAYDTPMNFSRAVSEVEAGEKGRVNIVARATNLELEARLRPIRLPLDKGLLGYRLFLIMPEMQERLDKVNTLEDLRQFSIGQATPWTDVKVLEPNGFRLVLANDYEGLFKMLGARRFDLFSRGVNEIHSEWLAQKDNVPGLSIERGLVLHYQMPRYYFVANNEQGARMAERIEDGLHRLAQSGEFERRYQAYKRLVLADISLSGRRVLRLPNPQLSPQAPTGEKFWWDDLAGELAAKNRPPQ